MWAKINPYAYKISIILATWMTVNDYENEFSFNVFIWLLCILTFESGAVIATYFIGSFYRLKKSRLPFMDTLYECHWIVLSCVLAGKDHFPLAIACLLGFITNRLRTEA